MSFIATLRAGVGAFARVLLGAFQYLKDGKTPSSAYQGMVRLFCLTGGRSNDAMSKVISVIHPPYRMHDTKGLLGDLSLVELSQINDDINQNGYYVFKRRIPDVLCDELMRFAITNRCIQSAFGASPSTEVPLYPRAKPMAVRYEFKEQDIVNSVIVQQIMGDASFVAVAQSYLQCKPILDFVCLWWNTNFSKEPDKDAAQFWHFDMDRIKWVKYFVYLTDVGQDNGPHLFVAGSHRTKGIPSSLLSRGYSRLTDADVEAVYSQDEIIEFAAPRGTVIAEDTRGLHKGKNVENGDRLVLQLQFSNSQFGSSCPPGRVLEISDPNLKLMQGRYPRVYASYSPQ